jgi:HEAT repeat protein
VKRWNGSSHPGQPSKRLLAGITLLLLGVLAVAAWQWVRPREPFYKGKSLSTWIESYDTGQRGAVLDFQPGDEAVRQAGSNAVPTLLRMLWKRDSALKLKLLALARKQSFIEVRYTYAVKRNSQALRAFRVLGSEAATAVPALMGLYEQEPSPEARSKVLLALGYIGPPAAEAVPLLLQAAGSTNSYLRICAVSSLGSIHAKPELVLPLLMGLLSDHGRQSIAAIAAQSLGAFGVEARQAVPALLKLALGETNAKGAAARAVGQIDPDTLSGTIVPALIDSLTDSHELKTRVASANVLGSLGEPAKSAVPALVNALDDSMPSVRTTAKDALRRLDPELAAKVDKK